MTVLLLSVMIFLVTLGLTISGLYFMVEAPATRKRMRARLSAIQQTSTENLEGEAVLLREELLSQVPLVNRILLQIPLVSRLQFFIQQAAMEMTAGMLILISMAVGLVVLIIGLLMEMPTVLLVPAVIGAGAIPYLVVSFKRYRRFSKFEELFPDAIDLLARAVRAGHAFTTGLELIAREMPEPVAGEFRITYEQQNFGLPLREALRNLTVRVPLPDVNFFVTALQIQRESGGNLAEILDNLSYVIRERFKILRQVKVFTAQGRMTLYLLTALPPATALLMFVVNPDYISRLFTDPLGHKFLAAAAVLQVVGYLVIRKIIRIKV
ncbi:MAG TPA: type II secretion system F family protein [Blastocatellia bacterium]|nr:type II secretion system F family protein [Blastocatellia bacterium]